MDDTVELITQGGVHIRLRTASPQNEPALAEFFTHVAPEDILFRFLTGLRQVRREQLVGMLASDDPHSRSFLAFDDEDGTLIATAMLACDKSFDTAEVAISVRADYKHKGVGWALLEYAIQAAGALGVATVLSIESRANRGAIDLEREMGFSVVEYPGDPTLVMVRRELIHRRGPQEDGGEAAGIPQTFNHPAQPAS